MQTFTFKKHLSTDYRKADSTINRILAWVFGKRKLNFDTLSFIEVLGGQHNTHYICYEKEFFANKSDDAIVISKLLDELKIKLKQKDDRSITLKAPITIRFIKYDSGFWNDWYIMKGNVRIGTIEETKYTSIKKCTRITLYAP